MDYIVDGVMMMKKIINYLSQEIKVSRSWVVVFCLLWASTVLGTINDLIEILK